MNNYFALMLAFIVGALTTVQSAINTSLGRYIGSIGAALVSFLVGTATLTIVYFMYGEKGLSNVAKVPPYLFIGGLLGALFVFGMIKLLPQIGAGGAIAWGIAGQLLLAILIDQFGLFGQSKIPLDWTRGLGATLLLIGVKLITK